jgi:putative FmdB family regulatory protein
MPLYEYRCTKCGAKQEVLVRSLSAEVKVPKCPKAEKGTRGHTMERILSPFVRQYTEVDKLSQAEARWGSEVESMYAPSPDIARNARVYGDLSKDLPSKEDA